ncbi:DMT family transporter [Neotamlana laminarinivorans]|uniref:DMT family transporter n=1 Tax=Neotamlana laminarinivorans TaxID=2883124 RepID=A0A9X1I4F7_9FLAO|nr:DMT family transporter [Tamlana laminarinivorans]MCB4799809.1 DMT family transporter [Tamlana laminarinivorans]
MFNKNTQAHLAVFGANAIYGANYIIAKGVMPDKIMPTAFVFIRLASCTFLFWLLKLLFVKERVEKKDFIKLFLCSLFGGALNQMLFFHGINLTSPIDASIIQTATPVLVLVFSLFILKEKITLNKILGITIAGIGAVTLILYGNNAQGNSSFLGNLLIFGNACSYGLYLVIAKTVMKKYHAITVSSWIFLIGFIISLPFNVNAFLETNFSGFTTHTVLTIGYVVLFTTFFAYLFNIFALKHLAPSVTSSYVYLQPVVSFIIVSILAYVFMQSEYAKDINPIKIFSCLLVAAGVYIVSKPKKIKQAKTK